MGQVEKIVDENVKNAVLKVLRKANLSDANSFLPQQVFFKTYANGSRKTKVFLPNKNGDPVPVKKVRIREALNSAVKLKNDIDQYVNLRKNHHVLIYKDEHHDFKEEVVSFWEAIKRKNPKFLFISYPMSIVNGLQSFTSMTCFCWMSII